MINIAHIHPMLVHFPLALLPVALGAQLLALLRGQRLFTPHCLSSTGIVLIVLAAVLAVIAATFGDMALDKALATGVPLSVLESHAGLGRLSAVLLSVLAIAELWIYRRTSTCKVLSWGLWLAGLVVLLVILGSAWFGGQLVYELGVNVSSTMVHRSGRDRHVWQK